MTSLADLPQYDGDFFDLAVLENSASTLDEIREMGNAVWLSRHNMIAIGRFADVQLGLRANDILISGYGVTANETRFGAIASKGSSGVITMDGDDHAAHKKLLMKPLMPGSLQILKAKLENEAALAVSKLATGETFEAMALLASHLPVRIVSELVGLKDAGHERMLRWSVAAFNAMGPASHPLTVAAGPIREEYMGYAQSLTREHVVPGGWADGLFNAVDRGEISLGTARSMIFDYATPSLDTTILATGEMLWRLATTDGAFAAVRANPDLIPSVVYESVRVASPVRGFTRHAKSEFTLSGTVLPAGSRVLLLNAAANRDPRRYSEPERFDVTRNPRDNLGWGYCKHLCAGMHLARLEMETLLQELVRSVARMEAGAPSRLRNNMLQGFSTLPLALHRV